MFAESNKWASPAFLRSTRSSLGPLADSAFDPFAEQDGYIPGRGRKRPRFSMRSNEWRLVDEPASPLEYQSAWNQTEELEKEDEEQEEPEATEQEIEKMDMANSVEPSGDMKETTTPELATDKEDIARPTTLVEGSIPAGAEIQDSAKVTKEFGPEHPVEHAEQKFEEPAHQPLQPETVEIVTPEIVTSHDNVDRQIATDHVSRRPTDTPRLLPLPSPGLPVPSPLMTTPPAPHGYFPGAPTAEQNQNTPSCSTSRPEDIAMTEEIALSEEQTHGVPHQAAERVPADPGRDAASMEADVRDSARLETELSAAFQVSGFTATNEGLKMPSNIQPEGPSVSVVSTEVHGYDVASEKAAEILEELRKEEEREEDEENKEVEEEVEEMERELEEAEEDVEEVEGEIEEVEEVKEMEEELGEDEEMEEEEQQEEDEEDEEDEEEMPAGQMPSVSEEPKEGAKVVIVEDDAEGQIEEQKEKEEELREREDEDSEYEGEMPTRRYDPSDISKDEDEEEDQDEKLGAEEEYGEDYDSEHVYDEEYEGYPESESESDDENYPTRPQGPPPRRTVHPEVIVLDSDSDDEPRDATQAPQPNQPEKDSVSPRREPQILEQEAQLLESEVSDEEANEGDEDEGLSDDDKQWGEIVESENEDIAEGKLDRELDREPERVELEHGDRVNVSEAKGEEPRGLVGRSRSLSSAPTEDEVHLDQKRTSQSREPAIDPELLQAGAFSEGVPSGVDREGSEDYHLEDRSSQSQPLSDRDRQVEPGLLFDGAKSPRPDNQTQNHLFLKPRHQLITPNASQGTDISSERPTKHTAAETSIPTPRETQEVVIKSSLQAPTQSFELASFAETEADQRNIPRQESIPSPFHQRTVSSEIPPARLETAESTSVPEEEELQIEKRPDVQESVEDEVVLEDQSLLESTETLRLPPSQPNRHANGLRSQLSYFAPLATLIDHFNVLTDTISVVVETFPPVRARNSPKEYFLTLQLTDPSMAGTTLPAQIFRPFKSVLPSAKEGDVILLRNFKVKSFNHSMTLLSSESSAWAVFHGEGDDAVVTGPPVEYGAEERAYAKGLQEWYREDGAAMVADHRLQLSVNRDNMDATPSSSAPPSEAGSIDSGMRAESTASARSSRRGRRSHHRRITIHELRDGTRYMEVGSPSDKESIHELRDGTIYANL